MERIHPTNKAAIQALEGNPYVLTETSAVTALIKAGLLEADPVTDAERYANAARNWCKNCESDSKVFNYAIGWSTAAWETVTGEPIQDYYVRQKTVFDALVLLSKAAGIEL